MSRPRRELTVTVLACAVGAAVVLLAAGRTWRERAAGPALAGPSRQIAETGRDLVPWLPALALAALAGAGALLATRGAARVAVAVLVVLAGAGMAAGAGYGLTFDGVRPGWPLLCAIAAIPVLSAGAYAAVRQGNWPGMGTRYERMGGTTGPETATGTGMWDALDRGEDPTERR